MKEESLKEMLLNIKHGDYEKINTHIITEEDIKDFNSLYLEFLQEQNDYYHSILDRKEKAEEMLKKLNLLKRINELILNEIKRYQNVLENSTNELKYSHIKDYIKAFEILKQLASNDKVEYVIERINFPAYDSIERHGYRDTYEYNGEITILAEKNALSGHNFSDKTKCFQKSNLIEIYNKGYSLVVVSNDEYKTDLDLPKITIGSYHPIIIYLQDDELAIAVSQFIKFIEENGPDIEEIEVADLVNCIKKKYQKVKKY